jgi:hypothetical protein
MPRIIGNLTGKEPILEVLVGVSASLKKALLDNCHPVPQPIVTRALLDIGSDGTLLDIEKINELGLKQIRPGKPAKVSTLVDEKEEAFEYSASLTFMNDHSETTINELIVVGCPFPKTEKYKMIIGTDILSRCCFFYYGPTDNFVLSYPSKWN